MEALVSTEDFIHKFHTIDGTTIGERRKHLFKLLKSIGKTEIDLSKLKPQNQLEESFRIDILIYFRNSRGLIDVFKTENAALIKRVVRIKWLWNYFDENIITEIFPQISFNSKLKIINKLSRHLTNTQQADAIYNFINEKYGMYLAAKLLPCCSPTLISENVVNNIIKHLNIRQILFIIKKHHDLTCLLLKNRSSNLSNYKCIFRELLQNHLDLFEQTFTSTYGYYQNLGRRATNKFMVTHKTHVIDTAPYFYHYLHKTQLFKSIRDEFPQFYLKLFPESYTDFKIEADACLNILYDQNIPNKLELFASTFKTKYGIDVTESDVINLRILELLNEQQRLRVVERHVIPNIVTTCFKKTAESLPALQKRIMLTCDMNSRAQLVADLVQTCRIHSDYLALLEVCKYVYESHCKDDTSVLLSFLNTIEAGSCLKELNEEHWFYVGKILKCVMKSDTMWFQYSKCLIAYAYFLFAQKKPLKPLVRLCAKKAIDFTSLTEFVGFHKIPTNTGFEKQYLIVLAEVLPETYKDKELKSQYVTYLCYLIKWNKTHASDMLSLFDNKEALTALLDEWQCDTYNHACAVILLHILRLKDVPDKSFWVRTYFTKKPYTDLTVMEWLIRHDPLLVCEHIQLMIYIIWDLHYMQVRPFFFTMSRNYNHLQLPQAITKLCLQVITSTDKSEHSKINALTALSFVAEPQEFITLLTPYYPVDKTEPNAAVYAMQQAMSRILGNITPPSSMLHSVLLFSKGDYTKFIHPSMYSIAFNVTEDKLAQFFIDLNNLAVSVRKHAIYLSFRVLDRNSIYDIVKHNSTDKNVSIRKFLLRSIFNFFITNPDDFVWNMLKESIKNVDIEDKEALDVLIQLQKVPDDYIMKYIKFIATFIKVDDNVADLIPNSIYANLQADFITNIIESNKCGDVFIYKCLIHSDDSVLQLTILQNAFDCRKTSEFLKHCAEYFIKNEYSNVLLLHECIELLDCLRPHDKYLSERLYLQLCEIYLEFYVNQKSVEKFAEALVLVNEAFLKKYKSIMFSKFCDIVNTFIRIYFQEVDLLMLVQYVIENSRSEYSSCMGISLLPDSILTAPKLKLTFNEIVKELEGSQHPMVSMTLSLYLNRIMPHYDIIEESSSRQDIHNFNSYYVNSYASAVLRFE